MSVFKLVLMISSLIAISPLCGMLRVDKFNGPKKKQSSKRNNLSFAIPYDEDNPDKNVTKNLSEVRWEKKAKYIAFTQAAPDGTQKRIIGNLFPASAFFGNEAAAQKFLGMDPLEAARHIERAAILSQNPKTSMPADVYFLFNKKQQQMNQKMNLHFADDNVTSIPVTREGWLLIQSFPKKVKCEFKNEEEFYTAELMRDTTDRAIYVASQAVQGGLKGALPGFVMSYASSLEKAAPAVAKQTFEETNSKSLIHLGESLHQGWNDANAWLQLQTDSLEEAANLKLKYGVEMLKGTREAVVHDYIKTGIGVGKEKWAEAAQELFTDNLQKPESLLTTSQSIGIGAGLGIINAIYTVDSPIQKSSISKI